MSYYFALSFASVPDKTAAYDLCQKTVNLLAEKEQAQEHIKNMFPFFKMKCEYESTQPTNFICDMWVQDVFQVRFIYWTQHNLLALCGPDYPKAIMDLFGKTVDFQNSTDQDYDFETWDSNIPFFKSQVSTVSDSDTESLQLLLGYDTDDEDYMRRSAVYESIFKTLELDDWLYGRSGGFERIKMSGLTSMEKVCEVQRWAQSHVSKNTRKKEN